MAAEPSAKPGFYGTDAYLAPSAPDAILRYADHARGFAELRLPSGEGPFPIAIIFHGGCFRTGIADTAYMTPLATRWQGLGVASLNVDYREAGDGGGWPGSFEDWAAGAALVDSAAQRYPIDRVRTTLVGHSAGAVPALWLPAPRDASAPGGAAARFRARAAIVLDGPGDLWREREAFDALCEFSAVGPLLGEPAEERGRTLAPRPDLEETLYVQVRLPAPAMAASMRLVVRENPGAGHFDVITPGHPVYEANEPAMMKVLTGA